VLHAQGGRVKKQGRFLKGVFNETQKDGSDCGDYGGLAVMGGWAIAAQDKYNGESHEWALLW
jgi:hypothetical protein